MLISGYLGRWFLPVRNEPLKNRYGSQQYLDEQMKGVLDKLKATPGIYFFITVPEMECPFNYFLDKFDLRKHLLFESHRLPNLNHNEPDRLLQLVVYDFRNV